LTVEEFLRRFLLHVLPRGFVRIRYFGFFAHRHRAEFVPLCFEFELLATAATRARPACGPATLRPLRQCPKCGGPMVLLERLTPAQLRLRSPPAPVTRQS
jgi:hypothetical protein